MLIVGPKMLQCKRLGQDRYQYAHSGRRLVELCNGGAMSSNDMMMSGLRVANNISTILWLHHRISSRYTPPCCASCGNAPDGDLALGRDRSKRLHGFISPMFGFQVSSILLKVFPLSRLGLLWPS